MSTSAAKMVARTLIGILAALCLVAASSAHAVGALTPINPDEDVIELSQQTYLLEDPDGTLSFSEVSSAGMASRFKPGSPSIGLTPSAYWIRYNLTNSGKEPLARWLDSGTRKPQEIDLYVQDAVKGYLHLSASSTRPFSARWLPIANFAFPVTLAGAAETTLYLRVRSTGTSNLDLVPRLWKKEPLLRHAATEKTQWLVYLGMVIGLCTLNLFLYLVTREHYFLAYVMSVLAESWAVSSMRGGYGAAFELFWPDSPLFEQIAWVASAPPLCFIFLGFLGPLVGFKETMPRLHRLVYFIAILGSALFGVAIVLLALQQTQLAWLMQWMVGVGGLIFAIGVILVLFFAIASKALSGLRIAKFILLAFSPLVIATIPVSIGVIAGFHYPGSFIMWCSTIEMILMSLVLADRLKQEGLARIRAESEKYLAQTALIEGLQASERELEDKVAERTAELQQEQLRTKELLHNILPVKLAEEIFTKGHAEAAWHESVTIMFADFSGFTFAASTMPANRLVSELNEIFAAFDDICDEFGVEKIKTIGDAYMAAAGLPKPCADHAQRCVRAGLKMMRFIARRNEKTAFKWALRIGIHSGPVVSGVVGKRKYAFDIWGDSVNIASRMESAGEPGKVNISAYTCDLLQQDFVCEYRGKVSAKGKGEVDMYFVKEAVPA